MSKTFTRIAIVAAVVVPLTGLTVLAQSVPTFERGERGERVEQAHFRGDADRRGDRGRGDRRGAARFERLLETFDANADGDLTQEEITAARQAQLTEFDSNGDGSLDLAEYEALWLSVMRDRMVDRFQAHDDDGDGQVTTEEFNEEFAGLVERRDRNGDGVLNAEDMRRDRRGPPAETADQ
ncbi:MAG: hypothetical protein AAFQ66_03065 [Pseudomonadota bacterium]